MIKKKGKGFLSAKINPNILLLLSLLFQLLLKIVDNAFIMDSEGLTQKDLTYSITKQWVQLKT